MDKLHKNEQYIIHFPVIKRIMYCSFYLKTQKILDCIKKKYARKCIIYCTRYFSVLKYTVRLSEIKEVQVRYGNDDDTEDTGSSRRS